MKKKGFTGTPRNINAKKKMKKQTNKQTKKKKTKHLLPSLVFEGWHQFQQRAESLPEIGKRNNYSEYTVPKRQKNILSALYN